MCVASDSPLIVSTCYRVDDLITGCAQLLKKVWLFFIKGAIIWAEFRIIVGTVLVISC